MRICREISVAVTESVNIAEKQDTSVCLNLRILGLGNRLDLAQRTIKSPGNGVISVEVRCLSYEQCYISINLMNDLL